MNEKIKEIAILLMSRGTEIKELIFEAVNKGNEFEILNSENTTTLLIHSILPYNLKITDKYIYNEEGYLIKQTILLDNKEKIVFDKFAQAKKMLEAIEYKNCKVA